MASITTSRPAVGTLSGGRIARFFSDAFAAVAAWNDARATRNALSKLSDRELDDIGLCRADIDQVVDQLR